MKKSLLILLISIVSLNKSFACSIYDPDSDYYNLFMQEIVNAPQYYPFLLTLYSTYYKSESGGLKNENIEEWQEYLGLSYENTYYLVFNSTESELRKLIAGKVAADKQLAFVTPAFVQKHKQALLYLAYAKYLEPYMSISQDPSPKNRWWSYYSETDKTADKLDYEKVMGVLQKSWKAETDKELKLRYGFQMVRLAHYNRKYSEAVKLFNTYVEHLNFRPAMYYHALNQKAGAERGLGNITSATADFLQVMVHSNNLKENVLNSLRLGNDELDYDGLLQCAKTIEEKNDVYLILGFVSFSNPLNEIEKIVAQSPDAVQAKVLMARAVNLIERNRMQVNIYYSYYYSEDKPMKNVADKRYPSMEENPGMNKFFKNTLNLADGMVARADVEDKNFWYYTASYLHFLNKDYTTAKNLLEKVKESDEKYASQKKTLSMLIDICEQPKITNDVEITLFNKYKTFFKTTPKDNYYKNSTLDFVIDVLANRYFLQKEYAKSFLLNNDITGIQRNPQMELLDNIETFFNKSKKNVFEQYIVNRMSVKDNEIPNLINFTRGVVFLTRGNIDKASNSFVKITSFDNYLSISNRILGHNRIECFNCDEQDVMKIDYVNDFPFIPSKMNAKELAEILVKLSKEGSKPGELSAKANYLIGNFFYNTSLTGYYRNNLRFDRNNGYSSEKYSINKKPDIYDNIYFKYYPFYYDNTNTISQQYLEKAYGLTKDNELKAHIAFALSKCEQEENYIKNDGNYNRETHYKSHLYFDELVKYKGTRFYNEVKSNCNYFSYYVNRL